MKREFSVLIEKGDDGYLIAEVPELPGCHTQARTRKQLMERIREAIELCLEVKESKGKEAGSSFIGIEKVVVNA